MTLHERLVALQSDEELERKAQKAARDGWFTLEDIDAARRRAKRLYDFLNWGRDDDGNPLT